jgi:hypothetical protein
MSKIDECPLELADAIREFWPEIEWDNAAAIAQLESGWDPFAKADTATRYGGCGLIIGELNGVKVVSERSVGYFQINACNFSTWEWQRFYNARHNAGTAHMLWADRGWSPWYFSARRLGLIS